jgi:O-antigen ligase
MEMLGATQAWRPISEDPYGSVFTLFAAIPAIAVFVATERLEPSARAIAIAIVVGMIASVFLGTVQLATGPQSWAYLQENHNAGAIGFFANINHMGTLLLVAIPMATALVVSAKSDRGSSSARWGVGLALLLFTAAGIIMNGSRAALGLAIPIVLASLVLFPGATRWRGPAVALAAVVLVAGLFLVAGNPIAPVDPGSSDSSRVMRSGIWATTLQPIRDSFPFGTGLGSFEQVFHWYENAGDVTQRYVNHAHNDYLEIVLELGAGGLILVLLFIALWATAAIRIWNSTLATPFMRAATIASAAILAHSIVDYPLRTAAIGAIFAACLGLMTHHRRAAAAPKAGEIRPTRHVKLG